MSDITDRGGPMTNRSGNIDEEILHSRIRTKERGTETLPVAEAEISRLCEALDVGESVHTVAEAIYRRSLETEIIQNRTVAEVSTASIYAACRVDGTAYSLDEVVHEGRATSRYVSRVFSQLSKELVLNTGPTDPTDFVPRFCSELGLSDVVADKSEAILNQTMDAGLHSGQSPSAFAAGAVYAASLLCNEKRTQREVADVASVSIKTIQKQYRKQVAEMGIV